YCTSNQTFSCEFRVEPVTYTKVSTGKSATTAPFFDGSERRTVSCIVSISTNDEVSILVSVDASTAKGVANRAEVVIVVTRSNERIFLKNFTSIPSFTTLENRKNKCLT